MEHETAEHATGGGFPPFDQIDTFPSQIFWLVVTFGVLYFVLSNVLLPRIRQAIEDRDGVIAADVAKAAAASTQADAAIREFEAKVADARSRARDTAARAKAEADAQASAETAKADAALETRLAAAERRIGEVRSAAMSNVAAVAEETALAIAEKLSGAKVTSRTAKKAVASAMGPA
ncbi:MAG: ATPase [Alphaproteobacteria bacterium]|nr:ATPase [Alphaproteobacteria bacterium]